MTQIHLSFTHDMVGSLNLPYVSGGYNIADAGGNFGNNVHSFYRLALGNRFTIALLSRRAFNSLRVSTAVVSGESSVSPNEKYPWVDILLIYMRLCFFYRRVVILGSRLSFTTYRILMGVVITSKALIPMVNMVNGGSCIFHWRVRRKTVCATSKVVWSYLSFISYAGRLELYHLLRWGTIVLVSTRVVCNY